MLFTHIKGCINPLSWVALCAWCSFDKKTFTFFKYLGFSSRGCAADYYLVRFAVVTILHSSTFLSY